MPPTFTAFVARLGVVLEPGQLVASKVAFDGVQPCELVGEERRIAYEMFGPIETIEPGMRDVVAFVAGARGGKSYIFGALRLLHLACTVDIRHLAAGEDGVCMIIAPTLDKANECFGYAKGAAETSPDLVPFLREVNATSFVLMRGRQRVLFRTGASSRGGVSARGRSLLGVYLDEFAFMLDSSYVVNDAAIYAAAAPRIVEGGQLVIGSTPDAENGLLHELWLKNWGHPQTCLVGHAPTLLLRTDEKKRREVAREYQRDPENAEREFGARFRKNTTSQFFDAETIGKALDSSLVLGAPPRPLDEVTIGADFGFRVNSSTLGIAHRTGQVFRLAELLEEKPRPGAPLVPSEVCDRFAGVIGQHVPPRLANVMADGHYRESVFEHLLRHGIGLLDAPTNVAESFVALRSLMREGRMRIPANDALVSQLRRVVSRPLSGGGLSVTQPQAKDGTHGDLVSALVLVGWQAWGTAVAPDRSAESVAETIRREEDERVRRHEQSVRTERRQGRRLFG